MSFQPAYRRVILKLSGESFCRNREGGISMPEVTDISKQIKKLMEAGVQVAVVTGGGLNTVTLTGDDPVAVIPVARHYPDVRACFRVRRAR